MLCLFYPFFVMSTFSAVFTTTNINVSFVKSTFTLRVFPPGKPALVGLLLKRMVALFRNASGDDSIASMTVYDMDTWAFSPNSNKHIVTLWNGQPMRTIWPNLATALQSAQPKDGTMVTISGNDGQDYLYVSRVLFNLHTLKVVSRSGFSLPADCQQVIASKTAKTFYTFTQKGELFSYVKYIVQGDMTLEKEKTTVQKNTSGSLCISSEDGGYVVTDGTKDCRSSSSSDDLILSGGGFTDGMHFHLFTKKFVMVVPINYNTGGQQVKVISIEDYFVQGTWFQQMIAFMFDNLLYVLVISTVPVLICFILCCACWWCSNKSHHHERSKCNLHHRHQEHHKSKTKQHSHLRQQHTALVSNSHSKPPSDSKLADKGKWGKPTPDHSHADSGAKQHTKILIGTSTGLQGSTVTVSPKHKVSSSKPKLCSKPKVKPKSMPKIKLNKRKSRFSSKTSISTSCRSSGILLTEEKKGFHHSNADSKVLAKQSDSKTSQVLSRGVHSRSHSRSSLSKSSSSSSKNKKHSHKKKKKKKRGHSAKKHKRKRGRHHRGRRGHKTPKPMSTLINANTMTSEVAIHRPINLKK